MRRFEVVEESMLPTLEPGDVIFTRRDATPAAGTIVVLPHPHRPDMWIVKRLAALADGEAWLESDNADVTLADSRTLGWVPVTDLHRAILRYRPRFSLTRL